MQVLNESAAQALREGAFIPAYPLALLNDRSWDEESQRILTHYYIDSGVGGLAVGVHTTQFEIRDYNLYESVLRVAIDEIEKRRLPNSFLKVAGVCGPTDQALGETELAKKLGYDLILLSHGDLNSYTESQLLSRAREVAEIMPVCGFYLQPSAGGRVLSAEFWKEFVEIKNVVAIKMAPFNRYQTLDVVNAVMHSKRVADIALYTGNDDNIIPDLLTTYSVLSNGVRIEKRIVGGLLGHWAVWTSKAVALFEHVKESRQSKTNYDVLLENGTHITDMNAAIFDVKNNFKGCIAGINDVLYRQGLIKSNVCLLKKETLSPKQSGLIDAVYENYREYTDDDFVKENIDKWRMLSKK